jgi:hypothetical protein
MQIQTDTTLKERLAQFLSKLSPLTARKLALGLEREKLRGTALPYEAIMSGLRPKLGASGEKRPGLGNAFRQFCIPFEDLLEDKTRRVKQQGRICRNSISPVWNWLSRDLLPDAVADLSARVTEHALTGDEVALEAAISVLHSSASAAIIKALNAARRDPQQRRALEQALGGEAVLEDAHEMAQALAIAPALRAVQASTPKPIAEFEEDLVYFTRDIYRQVLDSNSENAIYVPLSVMGRLSQPWQILRFVKKIARQNTDILLTETELAVLGEILFRQIEDIATRYAAQRAGEQNLNLMLQDVTWFARASKGIATEIDLRRVGEWGQRLLAARGRMSATVSDEISRFEHDLAAALPLHKIGMYGRSGPRRPDLTGAPQPQPIEAMAQALHFLAGISIVAESIGLQSHCKTVRAEIDDYLAVYSDGLIEDIRLLRGPERRNAQSFLEVACLFYEIIGPFEMGGILRRRGVVAAQD